MSRKQDRKDSFTEGASAVSYEAQRAKSFSWIVHCTSPETEPELPMPWQNFPEN